MKFRYGDQVAFTADGLNKAKPFKDVDTGTRLRVEKVHSSGAIDLCHDIIGGMVALSVDPSWVQPARVISASALRYIEDRCYDEDIQDVKDAITAAFDDGRTYERSGLWLEDGTPSIEAGHSPDELRKVIDFNAARRWAADALGVDSSVVAIRYEPTIEPHETGPFFHFGKDRAGRGRFVIFVKEEK